MTVSDLEDRARVLHSLALSCGLCPRACRAERLAGSLGFCGLGPGLRVARAVVHGGEEPPLVGEGGSGAVFFSGCTLRCVFCQNHQISQGGMGGAATAEGLAADFLRLQSFGCHNINLVTPTPQLPWILEGVAIASLRGLRVPLVYNTSGYESVETLRCLDGVVDVYLPDFKYGTNEAAERFSSAPGYVDQSLAAIREMYRQVGPLQTRGRVATRGLLVRHLVLPGNAARTDRALRLLADEIGPEVPLSLMAQYQPCFRAGEFPELDRRLGREEYEAAVATAESLDFSVGWFQEVDEIDGTFLPDFKSDTPFG